MTRQPDGKILCRSQGPKVCEGSLEPFEFTQVSSQPGKELDTHLMEITRHCHLLLLYEYLFFLLKNVQKIK